MIAAERGHLNIVKYLVEEAAADVQIKHKVQPMIALVYIHGL